MSFWPQRGHENVFFSTKSSSLLFCFYMSQNLVSPLCHILFMSLSLTSFPTSNCTLLGNTTKQNWTWCVLLFSKCQVCDHTVACCMFMFTSLNLQLTGFFPKGLAGWKKSLVFLLQLHFCLQYLRSHCYYESKASLLRSDDQGEMSVNMLFP